MQIWFTLKIKREIDQLLMHRVDGLFKKTFLEHACRSGERSKTAGTFRATKITAGRGLE